jgi:hypothetical protein
VPKLPIVDVLMLDPPEDGCTGAIAARRSRDGGRGACGIGSR